MKIPALISLLGLCASPLAAQETPQFTLDLEQVEFGAGQQVPGLHSFARAIAPGGQWLVVTGRTNGLHTFPSSSGGQPPANAFPPQQANGRLWVIDPVAKKVYPPAPLPAGQRDSLMVTNAQFAQDGDDLYVVGGYGWQSESGEMQTFPTITRIPVAATVQAIVEGRPLPAFEQVATFYDCVAAAAAVYGQCQVRMSPSPNGSNGCPNSSSTDCSCPAGPSWLACSRFQQNQCVAQQNAALAQCNQAVATDRLGQSWNAFPNGIPPSSSGPFYTTVTGGELVDGGRMPGQTATGRLFWMIFGQSFEGLYSVAPADYGNWPKAQVYTQRMAALFIGMLNGRLSAAVTSSLPSTLTQVSPPPPPLPDMPPNSNQWNRRDLNAMASLDSDGSPMIAAYGGVFVPGRIAAFDRPIYLKNIADPLGATPELDSYQQLFSQYDCPTIRLWSGAQKRMATVFLGGIGQYYLNPLLETLHFDSGLPFVNTVSVLSRSAAGTTSEAYAVRPLPGFLGANADFFPNPEAPRHSGEILDLDRIRGRTLLGWLYGGIVSTTPQSINGVTGASNAVYAIWLTPGTPPPDTWRPASAGLDGALPAH